MLSRFRERVGELVKPIAEVFAKTGVTPNTLTFIGLVVGIAAAILFVYGQQILAGLVLLLCGFFDLIDGAVARVTGKETSFGGVLDSVTDRYVDFLIFGAIIYAGLTETVILQGWIWGILAITGSFMVSYVRARAEAAGSGKLDVGIAERAERTLILAVGALVGYTRYAIILIAILTHITVAHRLIVAKKTLGLTAKS